MLAFLTHRAAAVPEAQSSSVATETSACARVFALARWTPNGDNIQTWRFRVLGEHSGRILTWDTRNHVPYDHGGKATHLSLGMLFESIRIAASVEGLRADIRRDGGDDEHAEFALMLVPDPLVRPDPLLSWLERRATNRGWLSTRALLPETIAALEAAAAPLRLRWFTGSGGRWQMARLLFAHALVRLKVKELWQVHRQILDWDDAQSMDRVPVASFPIDPLLRRVMAWAMVRWERIAALNRWAAGEVMPAVELDLLPALRCGAHVVFIAPTASDVDRLALGASVQRFWLTATSLGLQLQPAYTPIAFQQWDASGASFSADVTVAGAVRTVADRWRGLLGADAGQAVFAMRLGYGAPPHSRSQRLPMSRLLQEGRP